MKRKAQMHCSKQRIKQQSIILGYSSGTSKDFNSFILIIKLISGYRLVILASHNFSTLTLQTTAADGLKNQKLLPQSFPDWFRLEVGIFKQFLLSFELQLLFYELNFYFSGLLNLLLVNKVFHYLSLIIEIHLKVRFLVFAEVFISLN